MVGTIEPRKGHLQAVAAFERLWNEGLEANLVIVGPEGWGPVPVDLRRNIPEIVKALRNHPELGRVSSGWRASATNISRRSTPPLCA